MTNIESTWSAIIFHDTFSTTYADNDYHRCNTEVTRRDLQNDTKIVYLRRVVQKLVPAIDVFSVKIRLGVIQAIDIQ